MSTQDIAVTVVEAVVVRPGDTLVVAWPDTIKPQAVNDVADRIKERLSDGVKLVMIGGAIGLYVLRPGEVAE